MARLKEHFDHTKFRFCGAKTLKGLAKMFRAAAEEYEELGKRGARLLHEVDNGHVEYVIPGVYAEKQDWTEKEIEAGEGELEEEDYECLETEVTDAEEVPTTTESAK